MRADAASEIIAMSVRQRCQRESAVADHIGGDPLQHLLAALGIDEHIGVVMAVGVDEPGAYDQARRIENAFGLHPIGRAGYGGNLIAHNPDVGLKPGIAGAVNDSSVFNDQVIFFCHSFLQFCSVSTLLD